jgi:hypothetical protein
MFDAKDFYSEIRRRNKEKFIQVRTEQIRRENAKTGGVNIPEFLDAESDYNAFLNAGAFDCYGYLKQI